MFKEKILKIKINLTTIIVTVGLLIFSIMLFNWSLSALIHSRREVMVPDLKGKSILNAVSILSDLNLGLKKDAEQFDKTYPEGTVIRQNPQPGIVVREGKIIRVIISQGGETIFVPELIEQTARSAEIAIRSVGLSLGEESYQYSLIVPKGNVISQDPLPGNIVEKDYLVNLVISAGIPPKGVVLMPDYVEKTIDEVQRWADTNKIELEVIEEISPGMLPGIVIRQEPSPDTDLSFNKVASVTIVGEGGTSNYSGRKFYYEIPQGGGERKLRLTLIDKHGEREIFRGTRLPGSKLQVPINPEGTARVRIFINGILVEEQELDEG